MALRVVSDFKFDSLIYSIPLYNHVIFGDYMAVIKLIKAGVNLEVKNGLGRNALHYSCISNRLEILRVLLEHGADVDAVDINNFTPLHIACYFNVIRAVKLLLEYNANNQIRNSDGKLPVELTKNEKIKELLTNYQHMPDIKEPAN